MQGFVPFVQDFDKGERVSSLPQHGKRLERREETADLGARTTGGGLCLASSRPRGFVEKLELPYRLCAFPKSHPTRSESWSQRQGHLARPGIRPRSRAAQSVWRFIYQLRASRKPKTRAVIFTPPAEE
jgi:hypothetical protein